jgi:signal transduction histidine kinase
MQSDGKKDWAERGQTDESLRTEREKTDRALAETQDTAEHDADAIVRLARQNADAVLLEARHKADELMEGPPAQLPAEALAEERLVEDETLREERASADQILRRERVENARALAKLLPLERDKTDRFLFTERERSDGALSNRDDFLGIVSHDLRNLLGGVVVSAEVLARHARQGDPVLVQTARIQRYAARMNRLIGDLLDVTSIDAGKLAMAPARADFAALVAEAADTFEGAAAAKGIALTVRDVGGSGGSLPAEFDHDRMLQVLANLITNSIKFTPADGRITLTCELADGELRFSIADTGAGIPENMLEAVFERFWQVGKNDQRGLGLGLYISRCIVEAHAGKIWAGSGPGGGSVVSFTFPADQSPTS